MTAGGDRSTRTLAHDGRPRRHHDSPLCRLRPPTGRDGAREGTRRLRRRYCNDGDRGRRVASWTRVRLRRRGRFPECVGDGRSRVASGRSQHARPRDRRGPAGRRLRHPGRRPRRPGRRGDGRRGHPRGTHRRRVHRTRHRPRGRRDSAHATDRGRGGVASSRSRSRTPRRTARAVRRGRLTRPSESAQRSPGTDRTRERVVCECGPRDGRGRDRPESRPDRGPADARPRG